MIHNEVKVRRQDTLYVKRIVDMIDRISPIAPDLSDDEKEAHALIHRSARPAR